MLKPVRLSKRQNSITRLKSGLPETSTGDSGFREQSAGSHDQSSARRYARFDRL